MHCLLWFLSNSVLYWGDTSCQCWQWWSRNCASSFTAVVGVNFSCWESEIFPCWFSSPASAVSRVSALGFRVQDLQDVSLCQIPGVWGAVELQCQPEICLSGQWLHSAGGGLFPGARRPARGRVPALGPPGAGERSGRAGRGVPRWAGWGVTRVTGLSWLSCCCCSACSDLFHFWLSWEAELQLDCWQG